MNPQILYDHGNSSLGN